MFDELLDTVTDRSRRRPASSSGFFGRLSQLLGGDEAHDRDAPGRSRHEDHDRDERDDDRREFDRNRRRQQNRREFDFDFGD